MMLINEPNKSHDTKVVDGIAYQTIDACGVENFFDQECKDAGLVFLISLSAMSKICLGNHSKMSWDYIKTDAGAMAVIPKLNSGSITLPSTKYKKWVSVSEFLCGIVMSYVASRDSIARAYNDTHRTFFINNTQALYESAMSADRDSAIKLFSLLGEKPEFNESLLNEGVCYG